LEAKVLSAYEGVKSSHKRALKIKTVL